MAGDDAIELHGEGVHLFGRPPLERPRALKEINRVHMPHPRTPQKCNPLGIKRTPLLGRAEVTRHDADRRGVMGAALVEVSGQQHARDLTVVVLVAGVIV